MIERPTGRVLVVDDDPAIQGLLTRMLSIQGYGVVTVSNGAAAFAAIDALEPDVILLDVGLPGVDGFTVCRAVKERPGMRLTPIVLMTGLLDRGAKKKGIEAGADDFLSKPFDIEELSARVSSLIRLKRYTDDLDSAESVITSLALTVEARDPYTGGHCHRLAAYAVALGTELGLSGEDLATLQRGGYLHDVGKVAIPDAVLQKPGKLAPEEFETLKSHSVIGEQLCGSMRSLASVRGVIRHHHERRDGSGYPDGLCGDAIPVLAQIIGIVDAYDAITTTRPYRAALPPQHAFDELKKEVQFGLQSRELVDAFLSVTRGGGLIVDENAYGTTAYSGALSAADVDAVPLLLEVLTN